MWSSLKNLLKLLLPYGLVRLWWSSAHALVLTPESRAREAARREALNRRRNFRHHEVEQRPFDHADCVEFLVSLGCDRHHVMEGSMPPVSLRFTEDFVPASPTPLTCLHVGNFLGVSLAHYASLARSRHPASVVVGIDPNLPHRGIHSPQSKVIRVLSRYGLQNNVLLVVGYSLEKNISNDGSIFEGYDPVASAHDELSCGQVLTNLKTLGLSQVDLVVIDGNHDPSYLARELEAVVALLKSGGRLILDDVSQAWPEIQDVYKSLEPPRFKKLATDGRVGIALKC